VEEGFIERDQVQGTLLVINEKKNTSTISTHHNHLHQGMVGYSRPLEE
jgi:hypothetical protein